MKKFIFLYIGFDTPTEEIKKQWMDWFNKNSDKFTDSGNPFMPGKEVTSSGVKDLPHDKKAIVGYSIVKVESMAEAVKLAQSCPMITAMRVYEAGAM